MTDGKHDPVAHPNHYNWHPHAECIAVTQWFNFNLGNVIKYVWRAGKKGSSTAVEDLKKARQYIDFELARIDVMPDPMTPAVRPVGVNGGKGWISDIYQCGDDFAGSPSTHVIGPKPHAAHRYGRTGGGWCDGYL